MALCCTPCLFVGTRPIPDPCPFLKHFAWKVGPLFLCWAVGCSLFGRPVWWSDPLSFGGGQQREERGKGRERRRSRGGEEEGENGDRKQEQTRLERREDLVGEGREKGEEGEKGEERYVTESKDRRDKRGGEAGT
uniref:Uncharacterized protein n=1 Tax=Palpitomonas bilix TaxID=652834 RepID=A0A7S3DF29_9EUKA